MPHPLKTASDLKRAGLLIVAAGSGTRFGSKTPKQYALCDGKPLLQTAVDAWSPGGIRVQKVIVIGTGQRPAFDRAVPDQSGLRVVTGGATRQASVYEGLKALAEFDPEIVLIHDAARPFMPSAVFDRVMAAACEHGAALPVLPQADSLHRVKDGFLTGTVTRNTCVRAQTPQGFRFNDILRAHRTHEGAGLTDDAALALTIGLTVKTVPGHEDGLKVTTPHDLSILKTGKGIPARE